jgi:mannose-6-phosphate isomerase-like protein (cupin superfamily)
MGEEMTGGSFINRIIHPPQRVARGWTLAAVCVLLTLSQAGTSTQGAQPPKLATDITAAEVQAVINAPTGGGDRQMKVVDIGKYNVSVGVLRRGQTKPGAPGAINHEHVTEVYYIVSGSGTLLTGGTVDGVKPLPADGEIVKVAVGPSNQGTSARRRRHVRSALATSSSSRPASITASPTSPITWTTCRSDRIRITCCQQGTCSRS